MLGAPVQVKPVSMAHEAEQPSPLFKLLSSQASDPVMIPLPHDAVHMLGTPVHE